MMKKTSPTLKKQFSLFGILILFYLLFSLITFLAPNPFRMAQVEAQQLGNWEAHQVVFKQGEYHFNPLRSSVQADLSVEADNEELFARIELHHSPILGWVVHQFEVADDPDQLTKAHDMQ
ncbi:MAG: hypothetical protein AAF490_32270 [Chloroflexota bacterium]